MTMDASTPNRDSGSAADVALEVETGLLLRVLETAARALSVGTWPASTPPVAGADAPEVEAVVDVDPDNAGDDDGLQVAVFRFMTIVDNDCDPRPAFEMRLADARALARGDDADDADDTNDADGTDRSDEASVGDEVGVELSLPLVAAAGRLLVDRLLAHDDRLQPLPPDLVTNLRTSQRLDGIRARLASLALLERGEHSDLDDDGGMAVFQARSQALRQLDTNKCIAESAFVLVDGVPTQLLLIVRGDRVTLLQRSDDDTVSLHALRTALRPAPGPDTIAGAVVAALTSTPLVRPLGGRSEQLSDLRLDLASDDGAGAADLLTLEGTLHLRDNDGRSLDARRVEIPLRGDVVALCAPVAGNARDELDRRLEAAAGVFAHRLAQPLPEPPSGPESGPSEDDARRSGDQAIDVRLAHSALLRVLVRAARASSLEAHEDLLLSLDAVDAGTDDRLAVDFARAGAGDDDAILGRCILDPAQGGIVMLVTTGPDNNGKNAPREVCVASGGRTIDGDDEAARAFCLMLADAIAGTDADSTLVFGDDDDDGDPGDHGGETQLSVWLQRLAALPPAGLLPPDVDGARSWQHLLDVVFGATG